MKIRKFIRILIDKIYPQILYKKIVYSQDGEDLILYSFFEDMKGYKGFYIDIGAHHPLRFSNTAFFYKRGWKGINIEPTPHLISCFKKYRKRDINLNIGISNSAQPLTFYLFDEPALNSFDKHLSEQRDQTTQYSIIGSKQIITKKLTDIFKDYKAYIPKVDFLTIDVEGYDLEVLKSNNWEKYRPTFVLVEDNSFNINQIKESEVYNFLIQKKYNLVAKSRRTLIFQVSNPNESLYG